MSIVKAGIGSFFFSVGQPISIGIGFFDAGGNVVDIKTFTLPIAPYASKVALFNALAPQVIAYAAESGATLVNADILSIY